MILVVNIIGIVLIFFIIYWFWLSQPTAKKAKAHLNIMVANGVYDPSVIEVPAEKAVTLEFFRDDPTPCAQSVRFDELNIQAELPLQKAYSLKLPPLKVGTYLFTCQMGMYRGKLIVKA